MRRSGRIGLALALGLLAWRCHSGGGGVIEPSTEPLDLDGEYLLDLQVQNDGCGLDPGGGSVPAEVKEQGPALALVDIPSGDGACNPQLFTRAGDTLTWTRFSPAVSGPCQMQVDFTTTLTFFADGSVLGQETDTISQAGGDCSGFTLPCTVELQATGVRCTGCFDCVGDRDWGQSTCGDRRLTPVPTSRLSPIPNGFGLALGRRSL